MVAIGVVEADFEHDAGDALGEGVVVSAFGVGVGRECLLGDVVSEFCDTDKSALSHRRFSSAGVIPHRHPSLQQSILGNLSSKPAKHSSKPSPVMPKVEGESQSSCELLLYLPRVPPPFLDLVQPKLYFGS